MKWYHKIKEEAGHKQSPEKGEMEEGTVPYKLKSTKCVAEF